MQEKVAKKTIREKYYVNTDAGGTELFSSVRITVDGAGSGQNLLIDKIKQSTSMDCEYCYISPVKLQKALRIPNSDEGREVQAWLNSFSKDSIRLSEVIFFRVRRTVHDEELLDCSVELINITRGTITRAYL